MSARERIAAAVEFVLSGHGGYVKCASHFGMTLDVVKKACAAAGVTERLPAPRCGRSTVSRVIDRHASVPSGLSERERLAREDWKRERWVEKRVTKDMVRK